MQLQLIASPRKFLHVVLWLRVFAVAGESITVALVPRWLGIALPSATMAVVIAALAATVALTLVRLRLSMPATELEVASQLLIDIAALTVLLRLSGGTANPFASLYLIPVALSAVGLAWQYTTLITLCGLGCYIYLIDRVRTLAFSHMSVTNAFDLHVAGMHVTFAASAILLAAVLSIMAAEMRRRDRAMAALREEVMRKEHLSALGILAAGAAHELSTPLLSMSMLVSELRRARRVDEGFRADLGLLEKQIALCKEKLAKLLTSAGRSRIPVRRAVPIRTVLQEALDSWSIIRPTVRLEIDWQGIEGDPCVSIDEGFPQALMSLFDNAAEASESKDSSLVRVSVAEVGRRIRVCIDDEGPGLSAELQQRVGKAVFTTRREGFGLGLVLSHANLNRIHGELTLALRPGGGTRTTITLPAEAGEAGNDRD